MKQLLLLIWCCLVVEATLAQVLNSQVVGSCGEAQNTPTLSLNHTVGETCVGLLEAGSLGINQGFHQPAACVRNGEITGCDFVCAGDQNSSYTYEVAYAGIPRDVVWLVSSADATIIADNGESVDIKFDNWPPISTSVTLQAIAGNSCDAVATEFTVQMDAECVFPGDVNRDSITNDVGYTSDMTTLFYGRTQYDSYLFSNPNFIPPVRDIPCHADTTFDWLGHPSQNWGPTFPHKGKDVDMKHLDANGDGVIEDAKSNFFYNGATPPITDADVIIYNLDSTHGGNTGSRMRNNFPGLFLTPMDSTLENGNELRLMVNIGDSNTTVEDVHSIAFIVEFSLGSYQNPVLHKNTTYLDAPQNVKTVNYYFLDEGLTTNPRWYVAIGKLNPFQGTTFTGQELCHIECHATIAGLNGGNGTNKLQEMDSIPLTISIVEAGFVDVDGEYAPIQGNSTTVYVLNPPKLQAKAFLGGPLDQGVGLMGDHLRFFDLLPLQEPYTDLGYQHVRSGGEQIDAAVLDVSGSDAIVDWVFLEFRNKNDIQLVEMTKIALLQRDGDIVDLDGVNPLTLNGLPTDEYHVVIKHRNHLGIMSQAPILLSRNTANLDFTTGSTATYGTAAQTMSGNTFTLWSSDANTDGSVDAVDRSTAWNQRNTMGYLSADFNLDGTVDAEDRSSAWNNRNKSQQLP